MYTETNALFAALFDEITTANYVISEMKANVVTFY